jgi:beta-phosphoglucomutase-like phosphatase (HAD superfamily)
LNASLKPVPVDRMADAPYRIDAVLFDFDGTLTRPGALDFSVIKRAIGCPDGTPVLEFMAGVDDRQQRRRIWPGSLDRFELDGAAASRPNHGAEQLVATIRKAGLPVGILTRNSRASVVKASGELLNLSMADIDVLITREDPVRRSNRPGRGCCWRPGKWASIRPTCWWWVILISTCKPAAMPGP